MNALHYITSTILAVFLVLMGISLPYEVAAQSAENECETPDFNITSDEQVYALTGESFSYYVVTENNTPYQLTSSMPSGLSYSSGQITGTPQTAGDYTIEFTASNDCGTTTQSIMMTVVESDNAIAQNTDSAAAGSVGLNEIPDTGLSADTALTVSFYVLALLFIAGWFARRFKPALVSGTGNSSGSNTSGFDPVISRGDFIPPQIPVSKSKTYRSRRFGDGIRRE